MKGYKAFEHDMSCRGFQYEIGKSYEMDNCNLCERGFHFCKNIADCFCYYPQGDARFAEVEAYGEVVESDEDSKCVTNKIRIVKEIPREEAVAMSNTGDWNTGNSNTGDWNTGNRNTGDWNTGNRNTGNCNTGNWNTGNWNTGDRNTGNWNTGNCNTGNCNTGNWNTGDRNTGDWNIANYSAGCFCTKTPKMLMFDKKSSMTLEKWWRSDAFRLLRAMPHEIDVIEWIPSDEMTDEEKAEHPTHETTGGYLKVSRSNADKQRWYDDLGEDDKQIIKDMENFDAEKFYKCTGIRVEEDHHRSRGVEA